jgi:hypothetical protein
MPRSDLSRRQRQNYLERQSRLPSRWMKTWSLDFLAFWRRHSAINHLFRVYHHALALTTPSHWKPGLVIYLYLAQILKNSSSYLSERYRAREYGEGAASCRVQAKRKPPPNGEFDRGKDGATITTTRKISLQSGQMTAQKLFKTK